MLGQNAVCSKCSLCAKFHFTVPSYVCTHDRPERAPCITSCHLSCKSQDSTQDGELCLAAKCTLCPMLWHRKVGGTEGTPGVDIFWCCSFLIISYAFLYCIHQLWYQYTVLLTFGVCPLSERGYTSWVNISFCISIPFGGLCQLSLRQSQKYISMVLNQLL